MITFLPGEGLMFDHWSGLKGEAWDRFQRTESESWLIPHPHSLLNYGVPYYARGLPHSLLKKNSWNQETLSDQSFGGKLAFPCGRFPHLVFEVLAVTQKNQKRQEESQEKGKLYFYQDSPYWPKIESLCAENGWILKDQAVLSQRGSHQSSLEE